MTTRERNKLLSDIDQAMMRTLRSFVYDDSNYEATELLELAYVKISNAIQALMLPE